jgi:tripartite-type tricarboxylate transporter receptor subunit TctC
MLSSAVAAPLVDTKRLRALAVTTSRSVNNMASVPPLANTIPGFNAAPALFLLAPKGTSEPIIKKLNSALHAALNDPSLMSFFAQNGALPHVDTSEELARTIIEESKRWKSIAISSGAAKQ